MESEVIRTLDLFDETEAEIVPKLSSVLEYGVDLAIQNIEEPYYQYPTSFYEAVGSAMAEAWVRAAVSTEFLVNESINKSIATKATVEETVQRFRSEYGTVRTMNVANTTKDIVVQKVRRGLARGQSLDELVRQILNESPQISTGRAKVIVGTEAHTVSQYTSQAVAQNSGLILTKFWNSINDNRTRDFGLSGRVSQFNHRVMNGQARALFDFYAVPTLGGGHESLLYPGHPEGSPGNTISCRCIQTYKEAI